MSEEIYYAPATELAAKIRQKVLSPVEVVQAHLDRIERLTRSGAGTGCRRRCTAGREGVEWCRPGGLRLPSPALRYPVATTRFPGQAALKSGLYLVPAQLAMCFGNRQKSGNKPPCNPD